MSGILYNPPDIEEAHEAFGASCGPCAMAAILRRAVMSVRGCFPAFPGKTWVNPTSMCEALSRARADWRHCTLSGKWPSYGLAFLQVEGPWEGEGVPVKAAYQHTHWVAFCKSRPGVEVDSVFDVNGGIWLPLPTWEQEVMPLVVEANKRATGWRVRSSVEVRLV